MHSQPKYTHKKRYSLRATPRKTTGKIAPAPAALLAFRVVAGGGGAALERRVVEAVARVRVVMCELRAEVLEQHLRAAQLEADAGGPDEAA